MTPEIQVPLLSLRAVMLSILLIWLACTIPYTLHASDASGTSLEFVARVPAATALVVAGLLLQEYYLCTAPISGTGLMLLAVSCVCSCEWWITRIVLLCSLAACSLGDIQDKTTSCHLENSSLSVLWHVPKTYMAAPLGGGIGVVVVTFVYGLLWGKQVQRDRTVVWLTGYHSILLIINSFLVAGRVSVGPPSRWASNPARGIATDRVNRCDRPARMYHKIGYGGINVLSATNPQTFCVGTASPNLA